MRSMIVEFAVVPQDGVVGMVQLEKMLQRAGRLLLGGLNLVDLNRSQVNTMAFPGREDLERRQRNREHCRRFHGGANGC